MGARLARPGAELLPLTFHPMSNHSCAQHDLEFRHVAAQYGRTPVLSDIHFSVSCGQRLAIIGPNGAGKSTLLRILAGIKKHSAGEILWQNQPLAQWSREIAYLPQVDTHQQSFPITVREVVAMGRYPQVSFWRRFSAEDHAKVAEAMEAMEITDLADRQIDALSGGQQQRAFIARCLAQEAHVILLDEPFNGLDAESRTHLSHTLKQLADTGHLIIASHHNLDTVTTLFDYTLAVNHQQVAFGPSPEVMASQVVTDLFYCKHF